VPVAEEPLELTLDGPTGEGGKADPQLRIEALDRAQDSEQGGLAQVLLGDAPTAVVKVWGYD
jgi:hypothetical protein